MTHRSQLLSSCTFAVAAIFASHTSASAQEVAFNIPAQEASRAIPQFALQAGIQIFAPMGKLRGVNLPAINGNRDTREALKSLLAGSGVEVASDEGGVITLRDRAKDPQPNLYKAASPAKVQVAEAVPQPAQPAPQIEQVVVTGSHIIENGYQSPTPVTVATAEDLALSSPTTIDAGLEKLPQLLGSVSPTAGSQYGSTNHGNVLNLRGLGPNRTLILLDGVRMPATTYTNVVNVDVLPQLLVQRVDIVTGGASASYGSDAVAGVVNYILNTKFTGVKGTAQAGTSTFGDAVNQRFGLAAGTDVLDRGHFVFSIEYYHNSGFNEGDRPRFYNLQSAVGSVLGTTAPAGSTGNPYVFAGPLAQNYETYGGLALSGPFANTNFISAGNYAPVHMGVPTGSAGLYYQPSDYVDQPGGISAAAALQNINLFSRFTYDLDDNTTAYVQLIGAQSNARVHSVPNHQYAPALQIFSGNAFLPAALQAQLTATNTPFFNFSKMYTDLGLIQGYERTDNYDEAIGIKGKIGRFTWSVDATHGASIDNVKQTGQLNMPHFYAALDSVVNPVNGQTVCYPQLSANPVVAARYASCVPYNTFGFNAGSPAADAYITGTNLYRVSNATNDIVGNIAGDLFDLPAGPVSGALGGEYRTAHLAMTSNGDPANPPDVTGLRGVVVNTQWYNFNQGTANAGEQIEEGYGEISVPILKDIPYIESLDMNGAIRVANYSVSGESTTWKLGGVWKVDDELTLRATRSRDIRAPTLYDLFAGAQTSTAGVLDPHLGYQIGFNTVTSGNPDLKPEVGNTLTAGFSYQPSWLEGFAASVDYYSIEMRRAIASLTTIAILNDCEASGGAAPSCANITRPLPFSDHSAANAATQIRVSGINVAKIKMNGVDFDASYKTDIFGGDLTTRAYAGYIAEFVTQLSGSQPLVNYAGWNGTGSGGVSAAIPHFKGLLSASYNIDDYGIFVQENMIGALKLGPPLSGGATGVYLHPNIPFYYTTDLTLTWHAPPVWGANTQLFFNVTNLLNGQAPVVDGLIIPGVSMNTITQLYDTTGRAFVIGVRFDTN